MVLLIYRLDSWPLAQSCPNFNEMSICCHFTLLFLEPGQHRMHIHGTLIHLLPVPMEGVRWLLALLLINIFMELHERELETSDRVVRGSCWLLQAGAEHCPSTSSCE